MEDLAQYTSARLKEYLEKNFDRYEIESMHDPYAVYYGSKYSRIANSGNISYLTNGKVSAEDLGPDVVEAENLLKELASFAAKYLAVGVNGISFAEKAMLPDDGGIFDGILAETVGVVTTSKGEKK